MCWCEGFFGTKITPFKAGRKIDSNVLWKPTHPLVFIVELNLQNFHSANYNLFFFITTFFGCEKKTPIVTVMMADFMMKLIPLRKSDKLIRHSFIIIFFIVWIHRKYNVHNTEIRFFRCTNSVTIFPPQTHLTILSNPTISIVNSPTSQTRVVDCKI